MAVNSRVNETDRADRLWGSPELKEFSKARGDLCREMYEADDVALGQFLIEAARRACAELKIDPEGDGYAGHLFWKVIPEIGRRLVAREGLRVFSVPAESGELRHMSDSALRIDLSLCLINGDSQHVATRKRRELLDEWLSKRSLPLLREQDSWSSFRELNFDEQGIRPEVILTREAVNGNPAVIGMDRLAAPELDPETGRPAPLDGLAREMLEISARRGFAPSACWRPEFQEWKKPLIAEARGSGGVAGADEIARTDASIRNEEPAP